MVWLACAALVFLDGLFAGVGFMTSFLLFGTGLALAAWVALCAACLITLVGLVLRPVPHPVLRGLLWGGFVTLFCLLLLKPWELERDPFHATAVLGVLGPMTGAVAVLLHRAIGPRRLAVFVFLPVGALSYLADALVMPGLYLSLHNVAACLAVVGIAVGVWLLMGDRLTTKRVAGLVGVGLIFQVAALAETNRARKALEFDSVFSQKLLGAIRTALDSDRDGFSWLFGGGDCDDWNLDVRPGAEEVPDNGRDDNCNGLVDPSFEPRPPAAERTVRSPAPDVYFILVDALRADRVGDALSRFTARSLDFTMAYTPYPSTYRAMLSIFQSRHWRCRHRDSKLYTELLEEAGYDVALWTRKERHAALSRDRSRGDPFRVTGPDDEQLAWTTAIVDDAIAELATPSPAPRFRWLHVYDPHSPWLRGDPDAPPLERYEAEVAHVLGELDRLTDALAQSERGRRAVVVITGDHGEAFGEHNNVFHGGQLFEEVAHVPLLMQLPGVPPRRITAPVSLLDIVPTLAAYLGHPDRSWWMGRNLLEGEVDGPVFSHTEPVNNWSGQGRPEQFAVIDGHHKLIHYVDLNLTLLFDLAADPTEQHDITDDAPDRVRAMREILARWEDRPGCVTERAWLR